MFYNSLHILLNNNPNFLKQKFFYLNKNINFALLFDLNGVGKIMNNNGNSNNLIESLLNNHLPKSFLNKVRDIHTKRTVDTWQIFRIIAEFVDGFETLARLGPCVSIFGSARAKPGDEVYELTVEVAKTIGDYGYGIISGGGPGVMEAANKGAKEVGTYSIGLNIELPFEQEPNPYIDKDKLMNFNYFFVRKVMFVKYSQAFIVMPGGFGTLDELFEALTLIQTQKIDKFPVILVGRDYWKPLIHWIENTLLKKYNYISPEDIFLFRLVDTPQEVVSILDEFYSHTVHSPNF